MTMAAIAMMLGIGGKNPARTCQRYETGAAEPPISLVAKLELITEGQVTSASWVSVRQAHLAKLRPVSL